MITGQVVESMSDNDFRLCVLIGIIWIVINIKFLKGRLSEKINQILFELENKDNDNGSN